jgi:hypothetical protein
LAKSLVIADPVDVELEIEWPSSAKYTVAEVGFYFRVLSGEQPDSMFPLVSVTGTIEEGRMRFMFPRHKDYALVPLSCQTLGRRIEQRNETGLLAFERTTPSV